MSNTKTEAQRLAEFKDLEYWPAGVGLTDWVESVCAEMLRLDAALADELNNRDVLDKMLMQCITERDQLRAQLPKAVAEEREACAKVCESQIETGAHLRCAAAIRARSEGGPQMSNEQKLREALQAYQDANEMSPYGDYSKIEWESSAGPVNPSWGGGDCKKHGRWYSRCYSCSDEWDNLRKRADRDAYTARENALNAAKQLARQALATTEPEPKGMPELPEPDSYEFQHEETGNTMFVDRQQVEWGI